MSEPLPAASACKPVEDRWRERTVPQANRLRAPRAPAAAKTGATSTVSHGIPYGDGRHGGVDGPLIPGLAAPEMAAPVLAAP